MKKLFYLFIASALVCAAETLQAQDAGGVTIDGVTWAEANVGDKGRFVDNPWDFGTYYNFEDAQGACPEGWRLPTFAELNRLARSESRWTNKVNGVTGRLFGSGTNTLFLPAAGHFNTSKGDMSISHNGYYWSSQPYGLRGGYNLMFGGGRSKGDGTKGANVNIDSDASLVASDGETNSYYLRCVKK